MDGIKSTCFEGTVSCLSYSDVGSLMLVSLNGDSGETKQQRKVHVHVQRSRFDINPTRSLVSQGGSHPSLCYITHVPMQWAMTDHASSHKFTSPEPLGGKEERHKKRGRTKEQGCSVLCWRGRWTMANLKDVVLFI